MTRSAHLPIYDLPELRERNEALWQVVAQTLREAGVSEVPARLGGTRGPELFTQVCGYPLQTTQRGRYALLGTPMYEVDGCTGATHRSFIIVNARSTYDKPADLRGTRFAVNERMSNTGMNLARRLFARLAGGAPFFARITITGSHAASLERVASGSADAAAIDCVTYAFMREFRPDLVGQTRVLAQTDPSPAIPFVTVDDGNRARIATLRAALLGLADERRFIPALRALGIAGIRFLDDAAYTVLGAYEREAIAAGYPHLR